MSSRKNEGRGPEAPELWPYSPLTTPLFVAMALYLTAGVIHFVKPHLPIFFAILLGIISIFVTALWAKIREFPGAVPGYAAIVAVVGSIWVIWAGYTNPYSTWGLGSLMTLMIVFGIGYGPMRHWMAHEEAREKAEAEEEEEGAYDTYPAWEKIMNSMWVHPKALNPQARFRQKHIIDTPAGYKVTMGLPVQPAVTLSTVLQRQNQLEVVASRELPDQEIRVGSLRFEQGDRPDEIIVHVSTKNILSQRIPFEIEKTYDTILNPKEIGRYEDGTPISVRIPGIHTRMVGATGSGKSVTLEVALARITQCTDALVWVGAPDKGIPIVTPWLKPFAEGHTEYPLLDWAATKDEEVAAMLLSLYELIDIRTSTPRGGRPSWDVKPETPAVILVLEEATGILTSRTKYRTHKGTMARPAQILQEIVRLGRSEACSVWIVTQRGTVTMLGDEGGNIISQCNQVIGLRTVRSSDDNYVFPDDKIALHAIQDVGVAYVKTENRARPIPGKIFHLDSTKDIPEIVRRHTDWRPALERSSANKLTHYKGRWSQGRGAELIKEIRGEISEYTFSFTEGTGDKRQAQPAGGGGASTGRREKVNAGDGGSADKWIKKARAAFDEAQGKGRSEREIRHLVDETVNAFEDLLKTEAGETSPASAGESVDRRSLVLNAIASRPSGISRADLLEFLEDEGIEIPISTLQRWLKEATEEGIIIKSAHGHYQAAGPEQ